MNNQYKTIEAFGGEDEAPGRMIERGCEALAVGLCGFGFAATAEMIAMSHARWKRGEAADGIIDYFAFQDFAGRPEIFGRRDAGADMGA